MAQMSAAIFDDRQDAQRAVHALRDHGVAEEDISILAVADDCSGKVSDMNHGERVPAPGKDEGISTTTPQDAAKGAAEGAAIGAGLGLLAGLSSILIPGFGLITAGGALAWALGGAAAATAGGAVAGGVTGFLADMGVPSDTARDYEETLKRGGILVSVINTDEATHEEMQQIFTKYNGRNAGAYSGLAESGENFATPQTLDSTNDRLDSDGGAELHSTENDRLNERGDLSRSEFSPSAGNPVANTGETARTESHLDAVTGDEGSASTRLGDVRIGPNPDDFGASTTTLEATTDAVVDAGRGERSSSGMGNPTADDVNVRIDPPENPSPTLIGTQSGNISGVGGMTGGVRALAGGLGEQMGDQTGLAGVATDGTNVGTNSGTISGIGRRMEGEETLANTVKDMTGRSDAGDRQPTGAEVAGTAGGATAGANDDGIGDLESSTRADTDLDHEDLSSPGPGIDTTYGTTSGRTTGGATNTGGSAGITTSGGGDTSPTLDVATGGARSTRTLDDEDRNS